jgi:hypothetical protein
VNGSLVEENQANWIPISLSSDEKQSIQLFLSNDSYGYELFFKINITEIVNGSLAFEYQSGDTFESKTYITSGIYSSNVTTLLAYLRINGLNGIVSGSYSVEIGKKVSVSPWLDMNLAVILAILGISLLISLGLHPFIAIIVVFVAFCSTFIFSVYIIVKGFKSWKTSKEKPKLIVFTIEIIGFILLTLILLIPFRFSVF